MGECLYLGVSSYSLALIRVQGALVTRGGEVCLPVGSFMLGQGGQKAKLCHVLPVHEACVYGLRKSPSLVYPPRFPGVQAWGT